MEGVKISVILLCLFVISSHSYHSRIIIVEDAKACFRRALAGKRVTRSLVRRAVPCERIEDCQLECAEESRFMCEGFNYRLDHSGRGNGDCELLDLPMVRIDMVRDVYSDPDYDIYERDRNGARDCKGYHPINSNVHRGDRYHDRYDVIRRPYDQYDNRRYDRPYDRDRDRRPDYYDDRRIPNRRGDGHYHYSDRGEYHHSPHYSSGDRYLPRPHNYQPQPYQPQPYIPKRPYETYYIETGYKEKYNYDRDRDRQHWGLNKGTGWGSYGGLYGNFGRPDSYGNVNRFHDNHYVPPKISGGNNWGTYGGTYGTGGHGIKGIPSPYDIPAKDLFIPSKGYNYGTTDIATPHYDHFKPSYGAYGHAGKPSYGSDHTGYSYPTPTRPSGHTQITEINFESTSGDVPEHKKFDPRTDNRYNFLKDECSLRTATGFKLHRIIVKKYFSVPNIYECEMLCYAEKAFECLSFSYRYSLTSSAPRENCYLSNRNYKELDFYTDLEPDRDFDIYTINNRKNCEKHTIEDHMNSECFWHTRSGQRLEEKFVRDAVNVKNFVECQLECLNARKFTCRGFSFRYGPPVIGGLPDNCLLTDWPIMELDHTHVIFDPGFEIYERGSFGHGCEPNHFSIRGRDHPVIGANTDQLCYVGYGTPARLLPQAIRKSVFVNSELDCKAECSKTRHNTLFQCMSFSFKSKTERGEKNCDLSDILQRDLLSTVDYVDDPETWLFAWDNYNPECVFLADSSNQIGGHDQLGRDDALDISRYGGYDPGTVLDTWRVYSVSGWPCKRGAGCKENRDAGYWYCELEGGDSNTWDYCCRPDHQCGYSEGYQYQWCYVGPARSQWRKCSERYYPYVFNLIEQMPKPYRQNLIPGYHGDTPFRPEHDFIPPPRDHHNGPSGFRPDRPPAPHRPPPRRPSLNEYEQQFNKHFLDPPKPGRFGQPRLWPVSYLHKELPPGENSTKQVKYESMKMSKEIDSPNKYVAIQNLIEIIKSNDINNIQYQIENKTSRMDDILLVKIPLPTNFTEEAKTEENTTKADDTLSKPIDLTTTPKSVDRNNKGKNVTSRSGAGRKMNDNIKPSSSNIVARQAPAYRRSFITRTNVTNYGRHF